ncbi:hypothetical protein MP638_007267 [Amoeboaphelidium occidentale]|nr:hypothetical protein MP638_007267 [Amoeboaphelidium occidentale]
MKFYLVLLSAAVLFASANATNSKAASSSSVSTSSSQISVQRDGAVPSTGASSSSSKAGSFASAASSGAPPPLNNKKKNPGVKVGPEAALKKYRQQRKEIAALKQKNSVLKQQRAHAVNGRTGAAIAAGVLGAGALGATIAAVVESKKADNIRMEAEIRRLNESPITARNVDFPSPATATAPAPAPAPFVAPFVAPAPAPVAASAFFAPQQQQPAPVAAPPVGNIPNLNTVF